MTSNSLPRTSATLRIALLAAVVALSGCTTVKGWFGDKNDDKAARKPAELVEFTPSATVTKLWSAKAGDGNEKLGLTQGPVVADGRVYAAAIEGGVRALDLQTGALVWQHKSDLEISGGPGAGEGLVVFGTLDGDVVALDSATGTERWKAKLISEVIAAPAIAQGVVVVRSNDGRVTAFDITDGKRRWFWNRDLPRLTVRGNDAPTFGPGVVFVGNDDGTVASLALTDGRPLWDQAVGQPDGRSELDRMADVDGSPVLDGATLFASSYKKQTIAIEAPSGRPLWAQDHGGAGRVGLATDRVVVADPAGVVWALDKNGGTAMWQQAGLARRSLSGAAVQGEFAVVGDYDGYLHWLRLDNGDFGARVRAGRDPINAAPVVSDGILLVQTASGDLSAWRVQ
ncbi:outer membrane protein assembly factor BamB [Lysobacter brunescens]|uniref:Outer membrane protein assembly factor BamB n=1 Tax=Lysobacter brunescens TaxID=262323 RepID=A0ABW2YH82_9GAMM